MLLVKQYGKCRQGLWPADQYVQFPQRGYLHERISDWLLLRSTPTPALRVASTLVHRTAVDCWIKRSKSSLLTTIYCQSQKKCYFLLTLLDQVCKIQEHLKKQIQSLMKLFSNTSHDVVAQMKIFLLLKCATISSYFFIFTHNVCFGPLMSHIRPFLIWNLALLG